MITERLIRTAAIVGLSTLIACSPSATAPSLPTSGSGAPPTEAASPVVPNSGSLVIVGRIITMDDPPIAEAVFIKDGMVVSVGTRDEVLAAADDATRVIELGDNVAYPGFIDAHAHWIGDRDYYGLSTAAEAMDAALSRGWTSISEHWVNGERIEELEGLAADAALPIRVDAYLALNEPQLDGAHLGDWYADRVPGPVTDWLRVRGLKLHLDTGFSLDLLWEADELNRTVAAANEAGWQVSIHAFGTDSVEMALDAFEAALGTGGPNPLHHRIEHAMAVTDPQLARMVAMQLAVGIHLDTAVADWLGGPNAVAEMGGETAWLARWRDFVDAGLHVAGETDMPWILPNFKLTDDIGRPVDQIAGGMDPRGRRYPEAPEWVAGQLLTAEEGLRAVTIDAAYALGDEANRGHLAVGTYADITILSRDVRSGTPDEIRAAEVIATIVGGVSAFCAETEMCP